MTPEEHDHMQHLEATVKRYRSRIVVLKEALMTAKRTIKDWQDIENGNPASDEVWRLYQNSPEMTQINTALASNAD